MALIVNALNFILGTVLSGLLISLVGSFLASRRTTKSADPRLRISKQKTLEFSFYWTILVLCVVILWNFSKTNLAIFASR